MGLLDHNGLALAYGANAFLDAFNKSQDRGLRREMWEAEKKRQATLDAITQKQFALQQQQYADRRNTAQADAELAANPGLLSSIGQYGPFQPGQGLNYMPSADAFYKARALMQPKTVEPKTELGKYYALLDRLPMGDPRREQVKARINQIVAPTATTKPSTSFTEVGGKRLLVNTETGDVIRDYGPVGAAATNDRSFSTNLSPAEKKFDETAGKDLVDFVALGGFADVDKNIAQLEEVSNLLETRTDITGPIIGSTPDFVLKVTNPTALDAREKVEEVVQRNLRLILGAQFTEKEGTRLIERAFNPGLEEGVNLKRVKNLIGSIKRAAEAKRAAYQYLKKHGTLKGFEGDLYGSVADIERGANAADEADRLIEQYGGAR